LKIQSEADLDSSEMKDGSELPNSNQVDELRYLFLTSQVEIVDSPKKVKQYKYTQESDLVSFAITLADGEKCDRCWNYSTQVGSFENDPTICERCHQALAGNF